MSRPVVVSVGAGAVGGTIAARLARAGLRPVVLDADPEHVRRLRNPGLRLDEPAGSTVVPLAAHTPPDRAALPHRVDVILLAVRSETTERALAPVLDRLAPGGNVVSLQNGLNEERISALAGAGRTVGCVVGFGATWVAPGHVTLTAPGELAIGRLDGARDPGLERVGDLLARAIPTRISGDITAERWLKMLVNAATVLGACGGMLTGPLLSSPAGRRAAREVIAEGAAVAAAEGVRLPLVLGVDPAALAERRPGWEAALDGALDLVAGAFGSARSVTWRDLERGHPTEVDAVTGEIVRRGHRHGIPVPVNAAVLRTIGEIESGVRVIGEANLGELAATAEAPGR